MPRFKFIIRTLIAFLPLGILPLSCSSPNRVVYGNYFSQGEYIVECSNTDGWRLGHYLLTIDSAGTFELKEVSHGVGTLYTVCSGSLERHGRGSYKLKKAKVNYPYGVLGNPVFNNDDYEITVKDSGTIMLRRGGWKTPLVFIERDSIPAEFDFKRFGYDGCDK